MRTASIVALCSLLFAGCLSNPEPQGPDNTSANGQTNGATNGATNASGDNGATNGTPNNATSNNSVPGTNSNEEAVCDDCNEGDTRCDGKSYLECEPTEGKSCTRWVEHAVCVGNQVCAEGSGCGCAGAPCELGEITCTADGAETCLMIDGCPQQVAFGRDAGCALPASPPLPCTVDSDYPWCLECADGRSCVTKCDGANGHICGTPPE